MVVLFTGVAAAQATGGKLATSAYFPLVDGARYEYVHSGVPWASSTVVVRADQSWAGREGLHALNATYTCNIGSSCAPYATDFYSTSPDGVRHYGGVGANLLGTQFRMTSLTGPEWILKDPVAPGWLVAGGVYDGAESWTATVHVSGSMMGPERYTSTYRALTLETVTVPAGTFENALRVREQRGSGVVRDVWYASGVGMIMMTEGTQVTRLSGYNIPGPVAQPGGGNAALPFIPASGLWWNPEESGTGYLLQVQRGVIVVVMFSYAPSGDPVWYYWSGPLSGTAGGAVTISGALERYRGGQCPSCGYAPPSAAGRDGTFSIVFSSPASATMSLPGGRTTYIRPQEW
jgi:hypothetical protein